VGVVEAYTAVYCNVLSGMTLFSYKENRTKSFKDFGAFGNAGLFRGQNACGSFVMLCRPAQCFIEA
jgi:hypothetical protein